MRKRAVIAAVAFLVVASEPAMAEVSDKVIHPPQMWLSAIIGIFVGLPLGVLVNRWLGVVAMVAGLLFGPLPGIATVADKYVGPAILREAGAGYAFHAYASTVVAIMGVPFAVWKGRRARTHRQAA
jgi:hypothetical protein